MSKKNKYQNHCWRKTFFLVIFLGAELIKPSYSQNFAWAKQLGGSNGVADALGSILDPNGNILTTGEFQGVVDFDPGASVYNLTANNINSIGVSNCFISKLDSSGNFIWAKKVGDLSNYASGVSVAVDANGNVYTTGTFSGIVDFDPGSGVFNLSSANGANLFVLKLDPAGNFIWAKQIGGNGISYDIAVDASGNVYTTGFFIGVVDFDPGPGILTIGSYPDGARDIFVSKLNSSGDLVWVKQMSGFGNEIAQSITIDGSNNILLTGYFGGKVDFDPGPGIDTLSSSNIGTADIFICKLDASGNYAWTKKIGNNADDYGLSLVTDAAGNVYASGQFTGSVDFDPGPGSFILTGSVSLYIAKFNSSGNFIWAKGFESSMTGTAPLSLDANNNVYTISEFYAAFDCDPGSGVYNLTPYGGVDFFICKLDNDGNFVWAKQFGGVGHDYTRAVMVESNGNIYASGFFTGTADFDPGTGTYNLTPFGAQDAYIFKLGSITTGTSEFTININELNVFPNPFLKSINIKFSLAKSTDISFSIFDEQGKLICRQTEKYFIKGNHLVHWDLPFRTAGNYLLQLKSANAILTKKLILLR